MVSKTLFVILLSATLVLANPIQENAVNSVAPAQEKLALAENSNAAEALNDENVVNNPESEPADPLAIETTPESEDQQSAGDDKDKVNEKPDVPPASENIPEEGEPQDAPIDPSSDENNDDDRTDDSHSASEGDDFEQNIEEWLKEVRQKWIDRIQREREQLKDLWERIKEQLGGSNVELSL